MELRNHYFLLHLLFYYQIKLDEYQLRILFLIFDFE